MTAFQATGCKCKRLAYTEEGTCMFCGRGVIRDPRPPRPRPALSALIEPEPADLDGAALAGDSYARLRHVPRDGWTRELVVERLRAWNRAEGSPPRLRDWARGDADRRVWPSQKVVLALFVKWSYALEAAGLEPRPRGWPAPDVAVREPAPPLPRSSYDALRPVSARDWTQELVIERVRAWAAVEGRPPRGPEWRYASPLWPSKKIAQRLFGAWTGAIVAAGFPPNRPGPAPTRYTGGSEEEQTRLDGEGQCG